MEAKEWWEKYFPSDSFNRNKLPDHTTSDKFWEDYFPSMKLFTENIYNSDQFWKKTQRVLETITGDALPCPFSQMNSFIKYLYDNQNKVKLNSKDVILRFIEMLPNRANTGEQNILLWQLPDWIKDEFQYFDLLMDFVHNDHKLWKDFLETDGIIDLALDKFLPMMNGESTNNSIKSVELSIQISSFVVELITAKPGNITNFPAVFANVLTRLISYLTKSDNLTLSFYSINNITKMFNSCQFCLSPSVFAQCIRKYIQTLTRLDNMRLIAFMKLEKIVNEDFKNEILVAVLQSLNCAEDVEFVASTILNMQKTKAIPAVQLFLQTAGNNKIFSKICCKYLKQILTHTGDIPWIHSFIKRATRFILMAHYNSVYLRKVKMLLDLFLVLYQTDLVWLQKDISNACGFLLSTERIPMPYLSKMQPSPGSTDKKQMNECMKQIQKKEIKKIMVYNQSTGNNSTTFAVQTSSQSSQSPSALSRKNTSIPSSNSHGALSNSNKQAKTTKSKSIPSVSNYASRKQLPNFTPHPPPTSSIPSSPHTSKSHINSSNSTYMNHKIIQPQRMSNGNTNAIRKQASNVVFGSQKAAKLSKPTTSHYGRNYDPQPPKGPPPSGNGNKSYLSRQTKHLPTFQYSF